MNRWGAFLFVTLCSCSTYRAQSPGFRSGMGGYKVSSDYGRDPANEPVPADSLQPQVPFAPHGPFQLSWPVRRVKVNRGFHPPTDPKHEGLDLGGKRGTPILSAHEGVVIYSGTDFRGYGHMVLVEYSSEWATLYAHLDESNVSAGQVVAGGTRLGSMGDSGQATGVHLHFELLHDRKPVDPLPFLARNPRFARR